MSIDENENQPESDDRDVQMMNCTIYVGRVRIVLDPRLNVDVTSIAETRATEDHDGASANTTPKQTDFVGVRNTKPRGQRQPITTSYVARPKATKVGPTSRQQPPTSQPSCCLHGGGRCNYETRFGAESDNCIAGSDNCNAAARNSEPSRRDSSGRSPIWGTQNGGRLSPLRLVSRDKNVAKSDRPPPSRIPSQAKPPAKRDRPVHLYASSRLPVPVRPGPAGARILRIDRAGDVRPPSRNNGRSGRRRATAGRPLDTGDRPLNTAEKPDDTGDRPLDTGDRPLDTAEKPDDTGDGQRDATDGPQDSNDGPHDTDESLDFDDTAVEPGRPCVRVDETAAVSQPVAIDSDGLPDVDNHPTCRHDISRLDTRKK